MSEPQPPSQPRCVLIHSPLTGPSFWAGVRDVLWQRGQPAHLARLAAAEHLHPPYWLTHAAGVASGLPEEGEVILVAHSGAGPLLPAIGRLARNRGAASRVAGYLFVDCDLPVDGCSRLDLFDDPRAAEALQARCRRGWLPGFSRAELATVLPGPVADAFLAEQPRVPLALYQELLCVPDDWPEAPCAYLALSESYPGALASAEAWGWPVERLKAHHFLPLSEPAVVAAALETLIGRLQAVGRGARR